MKNSYIYANSQILAQDAFYQTDPNDPNTIGFDRYYYLHDRLGSVRQVIDSSAATVATYTYNPYGEDFATEVSESIYNPFKFTGQWYDKVTGQYCLRARQYEPPLMRFTGRDPKEGRYYEPVTLHKYLYCANGPTYFVDLNGENFSMPDVLGTIAIRSFVGANVGFIGGAYKELINQMLSGDFDGINLINSGVKGAIGGAISGLYAGIKTPGLAYFLDHGGKAIVENLGWGILSGVIGDVLDPKIGDKLRGPATVMALSGVSNIGKNAIIEIAYEDYGQ